MAARPAARIVIEAISLSCPHCDEFVANRRNYAFLHEGVDREELVKSEFRQCENCLQYFKLPVIVKKLGVAS